MNIIKIVCILAFVLFAADLSAQTNILTGRVLDEKRVPVPGATISELDNTRNATQSDENGNFKLTLKNKNTTLSVTAVGFVTTKLNYSGQNSLVINLKTDVKGLEDVVIVGFSKQKRITNTGAVSSVKASEVQTIPTGSIQNTLVGRLPGFFSTQRSGQPGSDAAQFYIRGVNSLNSDNQPLVIVDDIEYTYDQVAQLSANEIETISILKDAATTAIYGVKGANGVLVITTKRGKISKPRISATTEFGINQVIRYPNYMDSYSSAVLQNLANVNDSYGQSQLQAIPWSAADLQKFKDGSDPYGHPKVNWKEALLKNRSTQNRYNVSITGGSSNVKYFTSLGYFTQTGLLKDFQPINPNDDANPNYAYDRVNFRSNIDVTPTKTLNIRFDLNGRFETTNNPAGQLDAAGLFKELTAYRAISPLSMPLVNPDGTYGYASQSWGNGYINPIARLGNSGYRKTFANNFNIVVGADQKLGFITQGLGAKINVSYASNINETRNTRRDPSALPSYFYNSSNNSYVSRNSANTRLPVFLQEVGNAANNSTTILQAQLYYDRTFGDHHVYGLGLLNQNSFTTAANVPVNYRGLTGRVGYDFKQKYLIEFDVARNGNDLFRPEQRYGVFPAASIGWNIAEEGFFKKLLPFFDLLKVRGSYGLVGSDKTYQQLVTDRVQFNLANGVNYFGNGASEGGLINTKITWEKSRKTDIGLDANLFKGKITFAMDYFYELRYDQLTDQNAIPALIGQTVPKSNVGKSDNRGFEGEIAYKSHVGQLYFNVGGNFSHYMNKIIFTSEAPDYPNLAQTGRQLGLIKAYKWIGFYQQSDFDANGTIKPGIPALSGNMPLQPGDLRFADLNGDGVITVADQTYLAKPSIPTTTYGVTFGLNWGAFSLNALVQGATGFSIQVNAEGNDPFNGNIQPLMLNSWSPSNSVDPVYPRLGFNRSSNNITWSTVSDYTSTNGSYVRLKSLEFGYNVPLKVLKRTKIINSFRLYLAGYNLMTFRNTGRFQVDPEIANGTGGVYPLTANYNIGAQIGF